MNGTILNRGRRIPVLNRGVLPARHASLGAALEEFWQSGRYFPVVTALAALALLLPDAAFGVLTFAGLAAAYLFFTNDFLAAVTPLLITATLATGYYDDYSALLQFWWMGAVLGSALIAYAARCCTILRPGRCLRGLMAVSVAALLGGTGVMPMRERLSLLPLYYSLGLGLGMAALYLLLRSALCFSRGYHIGARFLAILYANGLVAGAAVGAVYLRGLGEFLETGAVLYFSYRNYCATMLLVSFPAAFYFARRSGRHLAGAAFLCAALLLTGSRSALLFGALELVCGVVYLLVCSTRRRSFVRFLLCCGLPLLVIVNSDLIGTLFAARFAEHGGLISGDETRVIFLRRALEDFAAHPLFGIGLGNLTNCDVFQGTPGSMAFYHNYFAQIAGSMGVAGLIAYGILLRDRIALLWRSFDRTVAVFAMCYGGMLLISMTNPGEFCPFPYEMIVVMLFTVVEYSTETGKPQQPE